MTQTLAFFFFSFFFLLLFLLFFFLAPFTVPFIFFPCSPFSGKSFRHSRRVDACDDNNGEVIWAMVPDAIDLRGDNSTEESRNKRAAGCWMSNEPRGEMKIVFLGEGSKDNSSWIIAPNFQRLQRPYRPFQYVQFCWECKRYFFTRPCVFSPKATVSDSFIILIFGGRERRWTLKQLHTSRTTHRILLFAIRLLSPLPYLNPSSRRSSKTR